MKHTVNPRSASETQGVLVEIESEFLSDRSNPDEDYYFFAYHVKITNRGEATVQLVSRHWVITDGGGHVEEVKGPGVVGEQPVLAAGESFEYTSACPLKTPTGQMRGSYQMIRLDKNERFDADIASFELAPGYTLH